MEETDLLKRALAEINSLRNQNELMRARLDMFDAVMSALHGQPATHHDRVMAPDVAYDIQRKIDSVKKRV